MFNIRTKQLQIKKSRVKGKSRFSKFLIKNHKTPIFKKIYKNNTIKNHTDKTAIFLKKLFFSRTSRSVGLIKFSNGAFATTTLPHGLLPGDFIKTTNLPNLAVNKYSLGDSVILFWLVKRSIFYNVILPNSKKSRYATSAGTYCVLINLQFQKNFFLVKIPSGIFKLIYSFIFVTLGRNANIFNKKRVVGKAGLNMIMGKRPSVRGVAMNPVDHPNGGRTKTNSPEKTPWGKVAKRNK